MGTAAAALVVAALSTTAHAAPCGDAFATCFDIGNRLTITAGSEGFGGAIQLRHIIKFDDEPDLVWKMQHAMLDVEMFHAGEALLYRGVYVRHARDGHIAFGEHRVFLPFDIGALFELGQLRWTDQMSAHLGVVRAAALIDLARSRDFGFRLAFGPVASWDVALTRDPVTVTDHAMSPFSSGMALVHAESSDGLWSGDARFEAGAQWHTSTTQWQADLVASASVERILIAINDHPIALTLDARYESLTHDATAGVGVRIAIFHAKDPRVSTLR